MTVTPVKHSPEKKCTMGAMITGLDLNNISNEELESLREAVHHYEYVVIKGQQNLDPVKHWELVTRLDPEAPQVHGHGTVKEFAARGGLLSVSCRGYIQLLNTNEHDRNVLYMVFQLRPM